MAGTHERSVNKAVRAGVARLRDVHGPLVELCRTLARQMDAAGDEGPSTRLSAAYLSALKDLGRVVYGPDRRVVVGKLATMRAARPGATSEGAGRG